MEKPKNRNANKTSIGPMTDEQLAKQVKAAQKGPFFTSEQVKQELRKWKNKRA